MARWANSRPCSMARKIKIGPVDKREPDQNSAGPGPHCRATSVAKATSEGAKVSLRSKSIIQAKGVDRGSHARGRDVDHRQQDGQPETPWARATRIR